MLKSGFLLAVFALILNSCASSKDIVYFQGDAIPTTVYEENIPTLQPGDNLSINVIGSDSRAIQPFNQVGDEDLKTGGSGAPSKSFTIDSDGNIEFPILGKLKLSGLTRDEAAAMIKSKLGSYIVDPSVTIKINNFRITVMGEVTSPGVFNLDNERVSILDALAMAGDMKIEGKRNNIMIIRERGGQKTINTIDLTKRETLDSPFFYLKQNDVVYVEPNQARVQSSKILNYSTVISVVSIGIALVSILIR
ncbi:MAG: polysaccharide biosynthesis/export family protein [Moheibacter sp.]